MWTAEGASRVGRGQSLAHVGPAVILPMDMPIGQPVVVHRCWQQADCWAETEVFSGHVPATGCAGQPQSMGPPRLQGRRDNASSSWEGLRGPL